ncbi:sulfatase [Prosthecobacter sp.]|uniref:sulfatase n=1 Tax=Prosthecobacter sp. TaxID=1965333 RepID=UPI003784EBCF
MKWFSFLLLLGMAVPSLSDTPARKPDVLVILVDQWSPRYLSWENPQVRTPHLDKIASEGMVFDRCYTTSPVCMPARVSLLTGLYPHNGGHGIWGNALNYHVPAEEATMFRDIKAAGYTTAQIGKTHWTSGPSVREAYPKLEDYHRALGLDYVFDVSGPVDSVTERNPYAEYLRKLGLLEKVAEEMHDRYVKWEFQPKASLVPPEHYHDVFVSREAADFVGKQPADIPLCVVLSLHSPHPPLDAPGEYATMYNAGKLTLPPNVPETFRREMRTIGHPETREMLANYLGKISLADDCIGRVVEAFQKRGTWDRTLVCFTADHGEMMGAHGMLTKGRMYEESARVPLVLRLPGQVKPCHTKAPVQMFDVYPTIVEAIGGTLSPHRKAVSLLPVAAGRKEKLRPFAISEIGTRAPLNMMATDGRWKWWVEEKGEFLFDLDADPYEMNNLAADPAHLTTLNQMREGMLTHLRSTQTNLSEGYKSKVQRMREAEGKPAKPKKKAAEKLP